MIQRLRKLVTCLPLILILALGMRMGFAWDQERKIPPDLIGIVPFLQETGNIAYSIALGHGFGSPFWEDTGPTAWLTPVYPIIVAASFRIFGIHTPRSFFAVVFLNILFSAATCVPIFFAGKRIAGLGAASLAAWLWALFPNAIIIPFEWVWDTSLTALLAATILWATVALAESNRWRDWCAYGLLWGFTLMTDPSVGSLLPFLLGWAAYRSWKLGKLRWSTPVLAAGVVILCCVPWTVRNCAVFHRFVPLRSNFPVALWLGNNEYYDPQSTVLPPPDPERAEIRGYVRMGETAYVQDKWRKAIQFIRTHRCLELILTERRIVFFWTGKENPLKGFLDTDSLLVRIVILGNTLAGLGALLGIIVLYRRRNVYAVPLAVFPVIYPLLYYVTNVWLRYRHPIDPAVLLLTAVALTAPFHRAKQQMPTG
ncbi:MAG: glycosyltransferase family 39 protein [Candidatus Acidiferrales bacterium]